MILINFSAFERHILCAGSVYLVSASLVSLTPIYICIRSCKHGPLGLAAHKMRV